MRSRLLRPPRSFRILGNVDRRSQILRRRRPEHQRRAASARRRRRNRTASSTSVKASNSVERRCSRAISCSRCRRTGTQSAQLPSRWDRRRSRAPRERSSTWRGDQVPVGEGTLDVSSNVLAKRSTATRRSTRPAYWPIHPSGTGLRRTRSDAEDFRNGHQVIDLMAPYHARR